MQILDIQEALPSVAVSVENQKWKIYTEKDVNIQPVGYLLDLTFLTKPNLDFAKHTLFLE